MALDGNAKKHPRKKAVLRIFSLAVTALLMVNTGLVPAKANSTEHSITQLSGKYKTQGRTTIENGVLMLDWSASGIIFKADCSGDVKITVDATRINTAENQGAYFTVIVDGVTQYADLRVPEDTTDWSSNTTGYPFHITAKGESTFTIATGLTSGEHTFEIYKQSEALYSAFGIKSITLNGTFLEPPAEKDLYIEFVGDSIAASYGNLANGSGAQMLYQDATRGWPYLTAQKLNADWSVIARTGITATKGIGHSGADSVSMPDVYPLSRYFSDKTTEYSFTRQPDVIVVCLGTNDISSYKKVEGATTDTVKQGFIDLITMLRKYNPNSKIVWIYGMMTTSANSLIATAINESGGFKNGIYSLGLPTESGGNHPGAENQIIYADMLAEFINSNITNPDTSYPGGYNPELVTPSASVVYYNFNEGESTAVNTKSTISTYAPSAMDYSATLSGAQWVDGFVGSGLKFNSLSDTLTLNKTSGYNQNTLGMLPTHSAFGGAAEYDFWVRFDTLPTEREQMILARDGSSSIPWAIKANQNGQIGFCWNNEWVYSDVLDWNTDEWYHINITNSSTGAVTIKRDGEIKGSGTVDASKYAGTNRVMYINGGSFFNSDNYFDGTIDELYLGAVGGGEEIRLRSKVNFVATDDTVISPQYVYYGETANRPDSDTIDWYSDPECTKKYDFGGKVITDITLYAEYKRNIEVTPSASVLYYNFNEGDGTDVNTKSTISSYKSDMDYGAKLSGSQWVEGFVGSALKFSSLSDTLTLNKTSGYNQSALGMVPTHTEFGGAAEYDFWVKFNTLPTAREQMLLCREGYNTIPWAIKVTTEGKVGFCWNNEWVYSAILDWNTDEWYHINITNSSTGVVTLKRDGITHGSGTVNASKYAGTNRLMYINGGLLYNSSNYFDGAIDELYLGAVGGGEEIRLRSKVTFDTDGETEIAVQYPYTDETATEPTAPTKEGYTFKGWYTDSACTTEYDFTQTVSNDITLYAKWEKEVIIGDANGDGEVNTQDMTILRQYLIGTFKTESLDLSVLDVAADSKVNLKDLVHLKKYFAGYDVTLG